MVDLVEAPVGWRVLKVERRRRGHRLRGAGQRGRGRVGAGHLRGRGALWPGIAGRRSRSCRIGLPAPWSRSTPAPMRVSARAQAGGPAIDQVTYAHLCDRRGGDARSGRQRQRRCGSAAIRRTLSDCPPAPIVCRPSVALPGAARLVVTAGIIDRSRYALWRGPADTAGRCARGWRDACRRRLHPLRRRSRGSQGRRELTRSAALHPDFVLPAGTYTVTTRIGGSEVRDRVASAPGRASSGP